MQIAAGLFDVGYVDSRRIGITSGSSAAGPGTSATGASSRGSSGVRPRRSGTSTMPPCWAQRRLSRTRITCRSWSTTTAGGSALAMASCS